LSLPGKTENRFSSPAPPPVSVRQRLRQLLGEDLDFSLRLGSKQEMEKMQEELEDRLQGVRAPHPDTAQEERRRVTDEIARIRASLPDSLARISDDMEKACSMG